MSTESGLFTRLPRALPTAFLVVLLLSACQSNDERAAEHVSSAQALLTEGDAPRALVELRNALALKSDLHAARKLLADTLLETGDLAAAYVQYTELAELQPNDLDSRVALATILLSQSAWTDFETAATSAATIAPTDPRVIGLVLARDYQRAVADNNIAQRDQLAARATELRATSPDDPALIRIAIDQAINQNQPDVALPLIEAALAQQPKDFSLQEVKLRLMIERGETDLVSKQFRTMIALFPTDAQLPANLLQWYLSRDDLAGAEAFLRERAGAPTAEIEGHVGLIEFIRATKGPDAAIAELKPLIDANDGDPKARMYSAMLASIVFEAGDQQKALSDVAAIVADAPPSNQTRRIKALYANMLTAVGDQPKAESVVAEILAEDASHVDALLLRAGWRVAVDDVSGAIIDLRAALNQDPNNARILSALANAYLRDGSVELAADTLGRAVEVAPLEPAFARDYGRLLQEQGRADVARSVLYRAWQANPADVGLVEMLSAIALNTSDWRLAAELVGLLRSSDAPQAQSAANQLESAVLVEQDRFDEAMAIFDAEIAKAEDPAPWIVFKVNSLLQADRAEEAESILTTALVDLPDSRPLLHRQAALDLEQQRTDQAAARYRALLETDPADELALRQLYTVLESQGKSDEAGALLDSGLAARPESPDLLWIKASRLQAQGELAEAIEVYENLYARNSSSPVIANNLASLLSQTSADPDVIDRAFRIARRFRSSEVPAFQDTYGWLLHLTGNSADAVPLLETAAAALSEDPSVQYHLGAALAATGQTDKAKATLTRALDLASDTTTTPEMDRARALLQELTAPKPQP